MNFLCAKIWETEPGKWAIVTSESSFIEFYPCKDEQTARRKAAEFLMKGFIEPEVLAPMFLGGYT